MSHARVADAAATETPARQTRFERTRPEWLDGRLARAAVVDGDVIISVHPEHMSPELCACITKLVAAEPRGQQVAAQLQESTAGQFAVRFQRVPAELLPNGTCALAIRGDLGTVFLACERGITEALAAELSALVTSLANGGTWQGCTGERQAS